MRAGFSSVDITPPPGRPKIGIQLFSLGPQFKQDAEGVLYALADMGYEGVEFAFVFGGLAPVKLRCLLRDLKLQAISIYAGVGSLQNAEHPVWAYTETLGCRYLTTGWPERLRDGASPEAVRDIEDLGRQVSQHGARLLYHNHCDELKPEGNTTVLDRLFEAADPNRIGAELDVAYFVQVGLDPVAYIRRYGSRLPLLHARDVTADGRYVPVGAGVVDFPAVIGAARKAGTEWLVVEQNPSPDALREVANSINILRGLL